ncbi:hypothetical protein [Sphingobacterium hungaricum]|uniref:Outer membrane protein beta-barrel domain-containing protein n=1 Tax=Sphingobacterium hungaricum TaxID=2082723 RepID=A0A928YP77_9SPHI|nr:hypothetical protein [Sphingobacterium hungaricum]MBE8712182.1 hypothetical protein [Sphingobacterium hungaricum]
MKIGLVLILFITAVVNRSIAQDYFSYRSSLHLKQSVGINLPITKLLKGIPTDRLIHHSDLSDYVQALSATYFWNKRWGATISFQVVSENDYEDPDRFNQSIIEEFEKNYYITIDAISNSRNFYPSGGDFNQISMGVTYRIEKNRLFVYPKLSAIFNSIQTESKNINLKEKNSNNILTVNYDCGKKVSNYLSVSPGAIFGYKITKWLYATADVQFAYSKPNLVYTKTTTNVVTNAVNKEEIRYDQSLVGFSVGAGLTFALFHRKMN